MPDGVTPPEPVTNKVQLEVPDASPDQETLNNKVDEILKEDGLNVPKSKEGVKDESTDKGEIADEDTSVAEEDAEADDSANEDGEDSDESSDTVETGDEDAGDTATEVASNPDFSFEVEDANGKSYKITKIEDLPEDFEPKNNRQVMEIIAQANKLESEIAKHEQDQAVAEEKAITESAQKEILKGWEGEIDQLVEEKLLSKPKLASNNPKYAEDPAVVKIDAVYKFISDTNTARKAAGNPNMLTSFRDALEIMELRDQRAKVSETSKKETDLARTKAGVIGTTSTASTDAPVYVAGSYRSMDDIPT